MKITILFSLFIFASISTFASHPDAAKVERCTKRIKRHSAQLIENYPEAISRICQSTVDDSDVEALRNCLWKLSSHLSAEYTLMACDEPGRGTAIFSLLGGSF